LTKEDLDYSSIYPPQTLQNEGRWTRVKRPKSEQGRSMATVTEFHRIPF
jgi:hypothetical protein